MTPEPTIGDAVGESEKLPFERHVSPERLCLGLVVFKMILHFISFVQVCVCMRVYMCACSKAMRKSEDSLQESVLSFHHVGHRDPLWGFSLTAHRALSLARLFLRQGLMQSGLAF